MDYSKPTKIDTLTLAFPEDVIGTLLPIRDSLPDEFRRERNPWCRLANEWFFNGSKLDTKSFKEKPGIERNDALRHVQACLGSFQPSHEHKIGGVGYLLSLWFEEETLTACGIKIPSQKRSQDAKR